MKRRACLLGCSLLIATGMAGAQSSLTRESIDSGAARMSAASFTLSGTLGQPDATTASSASHTLTGGFHRRQAAAPEGVFANGFE